MNKSIRGLCWSVASVSFLGLTFAHADPPPGWFLSGSNPNAYEVGTIEFDGSHTVAYLTAQVENAGGFGTLMQSFAAKPHRGKRLRLSANVKATNVQNWAGLWMRIDGPNNEKLGFDNMGNRPIVGTIEWQGHEIVLDVPPNSKTIAFGVLLSGSGEVMLDDIRFEEVDQAECVTARPTQLLIGPQNLDFES